MPFRRQTHLGSTCTKSLTIVDLTPPPPLTGNGSHTLLSIPATKNFIFQLPDELLVPIVKLAASGPSLRLRIPQTNTRDNDVLLILSRVCHRLRCVAQPLLFRNIHIESPNKMVPPSKSVMKLHRTLGERTDLRQHCRSLHMHIPDRGLPVNNYLIAEDFVDWLTKTRDVSIHGGFEAVSASDEDGKMGNGRTWSLFRRMTAKFEDLEHVTINREGWGIYLPAILKWLACPKLKTLHMNGISEWRHGPIELASEKRRTASFTSLHIFDYEERPEATSLLLQWPAVLTHFEFGSYYSNPHVMDYPMFENWLLIHQFSLTHIYIGSLSHRGNRRLFNATLFPNLEYLRLSRWQMHSPVQFSPTDSNVLGPKLKTFAWDFSVFDQHSESWCSFGESEANWVQQLAEFAVLHKAALKIIEVRFTPCDFWDLTEEMGYPWDRMDSVRDQAMRPFGLDLVYNKPLMSKDAWLDYVRAKRSGNDTDEAINDDMAQNEQSSTVGEQENAEMFEPEFQLAYQGEDIRGYFVGKSRSS